MNSFFLQIFSCFLFNALFFSLSTIFKSKNNSKIQIFNIILSFLPFLIFFLNLYPHILNNFSKLHSLLIVILKIKTINQFNLNLSFEFGFNEMIYLSIITVLYPISTIYSILYFKFKQNSFIGQSFHLYVFLSIFSAICIIISKNLLISFLFYEILTIFTYLLVIYDKTEYARKGGRIYFTILALGSILFFMPGLIMLYDISYSLNFFESAKIIKSIPISKMMINFITLFFILGITKNALFPMYVWLINAMSASVPVSALLHAVLVVKIGLFLTTKVLYFILGYNFLSRDIFLIFGKNWITILSILTIIISAINANTSSNLKKRLAYSTIGQMALMIFVASFFKKEMIFLTSLMAINHGLSKISLFFFVGELYLKEGIITTNSILNAKRINLISKFYLLVAIFNLIGLPFSLGFYIKKELISYGILNKNELISIVMMLSSLLTFSYLRFFLTNIKFISNNSIKLKKSEYLLSFPGFLCAVLTLTMAINHKKIISIFL